MSNFLLFSEEGIVLINKSSTSLRPGAIEYARLAKYICLSFALWRGSGGSSRSTKEIQFGELKIYVREIHLENSVCLAALLVGAHDTLDKDLQRCREMALRKLCSSLVLRFSGALSDVLNNINASIKHALQMGTFSDSIEASDDIEDMLNNDDSFQDVKAEVEKSLEPILNSVSFNCDVIVNGLQVLRLEHQLVCQTISYRSQAVSIEEPWIHLYSLSNVVESNYFDNLYDADVCGDKITMQYIVLEEYEGLAVLLVQKGNLRIAFSIPKRLVSMTDPSIFGPESIVDAAARQALLQFVDNCFDWL